MFDIIGQYLAVSAFPGGIWLSDNFGAAGSWVQSTATTQYYTSLASNSKGNYLVATTQSDLNQYYGNIYTTYNITAVNDDSDGGNDNSLSTGALIGIFVGGIAVILIAIAFLKFYLCVPKPVEIAQPLMV